MQSVKASSIKWWDLFLGRSYVNDLLFLIVNKIFPSCCFPFKNGLRTYFLKVGKHNHIYFVLYEEA